MTDETITGLNLKKEPSIFEQLYELGSGKKYVPRPTWDQIVINHLEGRMHLASLPDDMPKTLKGYASYLYEKSQSKQENWDNKGNIFYTDDKGNRIESEIGLTRAEKIIRHLRAIGTNTKDFIEETDTESDVYKQKAVLTSTLIGGLGGLGRNFTTTLSNNLTPYLGRKIGQYSAQGISSGLAGGGFGGFTEGILTDKNPFMTAFTNGLSGAAAGGLLGYAGGSIGKFLEGNQLKFLNDLKYLRNMETKYYKNYIQQTFVNRDDLGRINFTQSGLETVSKQPEAGRNFINLKNEIKNAKYLRKESPIHDRKDDITNFHVLGNGKQEFIIGETNKSNKYYMSKLISEPIIRPSRVGIDSPNSIIPNLLSNFKLPEFMDFVKNIFQK